MYLQNFLLYEPKVKQAASKVVSACWTKEI